MGRSNSPSFFSITKMTTIIKTGLLQQLFNFFNWEVTCECCGSRFDGSHNETKNLPEQINIPLSTKETRSIENNRNLLQDITIDRVSDKLFENMISPSAQKPNIKSAIRKKKNVVKDFYGRPRWNQENENQLRLYIQQYGANYELVKEFFPSFEKGELKKKINRILINKEDLLRKKVSPLIKKGLKLEDVQGILASENTEEVERTYNKVLLSNKMKHLELGIEDDADADNNNFNENIWNIDADEDECVNETMVFKNGFINEMKGSREPSENGSYQEHCFEDNDLGNIDPYNFELKGKGIDLNACGGVYKGSFETCVDTVDMFYMVNTEITDAFNMNDGISDRSFNRIGKEAIFDDDSSSEVENELKTKSMDVLGVLSN